MSSCSCGSLSQPAYMNTCNARNPIAALLLALSACILAAQTPAGWTRRIPQTFPSSERTGHALAYDSTHGQVVLFGGYDALLGNDFLNDTWVWDGSNWTQKSPISSPPPRWHSAMAYDSAHGQVILFGGQVGVCCVGGTFLKDTWVWNGATWSSKTPETGPPALFGHAMAYDSAHGQVVLFGGQSSFTSLPLNDTWVWDGSSWTQKTPQTRPPARFGYAMAFDSARGQVILFGGHHRLGYSDDLNDTWVWDGVNWSQKSPQNSPPARSSHAMAYDAGHGQVVLFGGADDYTTVFNMPEIFNDTWVWDGSNWTQKSPKNSPIARVDCAMAYDSAHEQVVLFGGGAAEDYPYHDTWTWQGGTLPPPVPSISGVFSASGFGGFSTVAPGSWVEIYGSNLASTTRGWRGSDFNGDNAPTSLDGVQVNIGNEKAFIDYIAASPGQINAQLPSNITLGTLQLTVTNANGTSAPFNVAVKSTEAGLLAPASFQIDGKQYVAALLADNITYVLPAGSIPGVLSRPAQPGETITFYGIGFGSVTPDSPAGQIVQQQNQLVLPLQILFGQTPAQVLYAGLSPGSLGLYQFDVVVPAVPDSDLVPVTFNLGGVAGGQILYTAVLQ